MSGGLFGVALEELVKWAVPTMLAGGSAWWLVKRKVLAERRAARRAHAAAMAALPDQVAAIAAAVDGIGKQVRPNGGGSLMDAVTRTESAVQQHGTALSEVRGILRAQSDMADDGAFQCTPDGRNTFVNLTYARMLGVGKADLLGSQWKNYIAPEEAIAFLAANAAALAEHRPFNGRCHMVRSDGDRVLVDVTMQPDPEQPPATRWFGKVREVR